MDTANTPKPKTPQILHADKQGQNPTSPRLNSLGPCKPHDRGESKLIDPETIRIATVLISAGIFSYCVLSGIAKVIKATTIARKIEQNIINQIEDMVKAKLEMEKVNAT